MSIIYKWTNRNKQDVYEDADKAHDLKFINIYIHYYEDWKMQETQKNRNKINRNIV